MVQASVPASHAQISETPELVIEDVLRSSQTAELVAEPVRHFPKIKDRSYKKAVVMDLQHKVYEQAECIQQLIGMIRSLSQQHQQHMATVQDTMVQLAVTNQQLKEQLAEKEVNMFGLQVDLENLQKGSQKSALQKQRVKALTGNLDRLQTQYTALQEQVRQIPPATSMPLKEIPSTPMAAVEEKEQARLATPIRQTTAKPRRLFADLTNANPAPVFQDALQPMADGGIYSPNVMVRLKALEQRKERVVHRLDQRDQVLKENLSPLQKHEKKSILKRRMIEGATLKSIKNAIEKEELEREAQEN
jgi:hypothetical protein